MRTLRVTPVCALTAYQYNLIMYGCLAVVVGPAIAHLTLETVNLQLQPQGAFYVLAQPLVEHLYRGRQHYDTFVNEDVTIGSWLLGVSALIR